MGCGKSKHAVVTETSVIKSMKSNDGKETHTTKTVTENGDSKSVQQVETTSSVVEETVTTKTDPIVDNVGASAAAPTLSGEDTQVVKKDEKVKDSSNVGPTLATRESVKEGEEVKDSDVVMPSNDDKKKENAGPIAVENVVENTVIVKDDEDFEDSKEENVENSIAFVTPVKTIDDSSNQEYATPKVQEQKDLAPLEDLTKVETKKEEDVEVKGADISKAEATLTAQPEKVPTANEANVAETKEKESETK